MADALFTDEEYTTLAEVLKALIRHSRITNNRVALRCAQAEMNRLSREYGRAKCEAIARELDARAPLGSLSSPAQQGSIP